jgi:S1-C subfamily serine protease
MDKQAHCVFRRALRAAAAALALCVVSLYSAGPVRAQSAVDPVPPDPPAQPSQLQGPNEYLDTREAPMELSQLGIQVRDDGAKLKDGREVRGVAVVDVSRKGAGGGAFAAHQTSRYVMTGVLIGTGAAAAVFFPPAIIAVALLANSRIGQSFDLIIGVDGIRVRNTFELVQAVADVRPGDTVYLAMVREGRRIQVAVPVQ